jgi:hypothetical protein
MNSRDLNTVNRTFLWPKTKDLGIIQAGTSLYKQDKFIAELEKLISKQKAWAPVAGSTKRTEPISKLERWIRDQESRKRIVDSQLGFSFNISLNIQSFPTIQGKPSKRTITTSRNIAYLLDASDDFLYILGLAFGEKTRFDAESCLEKELGVFVYITNSIESGGRAFKGDPFTGQAAAYSRIFAHDLLGNRVLNFVAYYPHQLYSQFYEQNGKIPNNKGVKMLRSQATLIITSGGILIEPTNWRICR